MSDGHISLYFGLKDGEKADLEVIAAAALQWVEAMRAAARELDPAAKIRVELVNASEGSLRLNAVLEWAEQQVRNVQEGSGKYPRLRNLALGLVVFVPTVAIPTYEFYFGDEPSISLSEEDRKLLKELIERTGKNPEVKTKTQKFFRTLERDSSISSAGIAEGHAAKPAIVVPSDQFAERSGLWVSPADEEERERTTYPVFDVTLVAPALVPTHRAWTFQPNGLPEFSATMRDDKFLAALEANSVRESLRAGIPMTVRLEVKEKKVNGAWVVKKRGRSVIEVISPTID